MGFQVGIRDVSSIKNNFLNIFGFVFYLTSMPLWIEEKGVVKEKTMRRDGHAPMGTSEEFKPI